MNWLDLERALDALGGSAQVLEVGTGAGALFRYLTEHMAVSSGQWRLTTVDIDPGPASAAREQLRRQPRRVRSRTSVIQGDVVEMSSSPEHGGRYTIVVASALLSAVQLSRPWGVGKVLRSLCDLLCPEGRLFLEDYMPLPPAAGRPNTAEEIARALWRWNKALAELAGRPHYQEVPPEWVAARLDELGFDEIKVNRDDRQLMRDPDQQLRYMRTLVAKPDGVDDTLWLALDRYRRGLLLQASEVGLAQWSGSFEVNARKHGGTE